MSAPSPAPSKHARFAAEGSPTGEEDAISGESRLQAVQEKLPRRTGAREQCCTASFISCLRCCCYCCRYSSRSSKYVCRSQSDAVKLAEPKLDNTGVTRREGQRGKVLASWMRKLSTTKNTASLSTAWTQHHKHLFARTCPFIPPYYAKLLYLYNS